MIIGQRFTARRLQGGISLIEILITVLVLAIGLLGLAGLQLTSLRNNQNAMERSVAVVQSYSIIEAIRADADSAKSGRFNVELGSAPSGSTFPAQALISWREQLALNLGETAAGSVACSSTGCTVTVQWEDPRAFDGSGKQKIVTEVRL
ncbi:type IV pilus modification protein PilV [Pseudomonas saliphila]|uniref:type IV pilus modification protein PilV n=1 Tax=Pseudomonas saliphila TaxID=2586906 RepID=UPI001239BACA|nr:type IV pilus modification protein PilV [Pseudomonas saliphila]